MIPRLIFVILTSLALVILCGLERYAWAAEYPDHESTEIYMLQTITNGAFFKTEKECKKEGEARERRGEILTFICVPGRGTPSNN
jgi:hypothetical protein